MITPIVPLDIKFGNIEERSCIFGVLIHRCWYQMITLDKNENEQTLLREICGEKDELDTTSERLEKY